MELLSSSSLSRHLQTSSELYDKIEWGIDIPFQYGRAPAPVVAFILGFICSIIVVLQIRNRFGVIRKILEDKYELNDGELSRSMTRRAFLAALMDGGDPMYTIMTQTATNLIFLGGFQLHYETTYAIMCIYYIFVSAIDLSRIFLTTSEFDSLRDFVVSVKRSSSPSGKTVKFHNIQDINKTTLTINPRNVYQNMALNGLLIAIVFVAQVVLFSFVMWDTIKAQSTCLNLGENKSFAEQGFTDLGYNCPITGMTISYMLYVVGILLQCAFLLGPGNDHGHPQLDPTFWTAVLLSCKQDRAEVSWMRPNGFGMQGSRKKSCTLGRNDFRLWLRLTLSFIVNGFGFRVLLHSLPIQLASRKNLLQIIFQALGVIYVAKLDDARGVTLTLTDFVAEKNTAYTTKKKDGDDGVFEEFANLSDLAVGVLLQNVYKQDNDINDREEILNIITNDTNVDDNNRMKNNEGEEEEQEVEEEQDEDDTSC